jgi:pyruvate formate lyase activating enzyme
MIYIKGLQKTSLVDYPPNIVASIFLGYCNFRCPYCHNPDLVLKADETENLIEEDIFRFLKGRKLWLDGVCVSGGEPAMHKELPQFLSKIKELGLKVKLDTNGYYPKMLRELIKRKLVDYFAMDIKGPLDKYEAVAKIKIDPDVIQQSVNMIRNSGIDYEFRTTVVKGILEKDDFIKMGEWLKGSEKLFLQRFNDKKPVIDQELKGKDNYDMNELEEFKKILEPYFKKVEVRGI